MSKDLLYRPDLNYEKNYYTEGRIFNIIENEESIGNDSNNSLSDKADSIKDIVDDIKNKLPLIPTDMLDVFLPSFIVVNDTLEDITDSVIDLPDDIIEETPGTIIIPGDTSTNDPSIKEEIPDNPFNFGTDIRVVTPDPIEQDKEKELDKQYFEDLMDVIKDYMFNYNHTLDKYLTNTITFLSESKFSSLKNVTTKELHDRNLSHISDYITKSKIALKQQTLLYKKMFDTEETIFHIRSVKVANEQRKRYELNKKVENENMLSKGANDLLKESKMVAQKKYEENFYGLYKYLNSSVILFNECMNTVIKQKQSLILLNNKEREN